MLVFLHGCELRALGIRTTKQQHLQCRHAYCLVSEPATLLIGLYTARALRT